MTPYNKVKPLKVSLLQHYTWSYWVILMNNMHLL